MLIIRDMQSIFLSGLIFKFLQLTAYLIDQCSLKIKNLSSGFKFFYLFFCIKINFICHSKYSVTKVRFHIIMWNFRVKNSTYFYPCSESLHWGKDYFSHSWKEWVIDYCLTPNEQCFSHIMARTSYIQWNDGDVCFVLDQHAELDFYSAGSLKQQSADRHVAPLGHIILILSQPVFALTP